MRIDTGSILKQYDANVENYNQLAEFVKYELIKAIKSQGIKTHTISHRIKEPDSLLAKIRRKQIGNPFEQLHDLVGFRIVCLFLPDLDEIKRIIYEKFEVFEEDDKINDTELNIFGYMSLHLKCRIKPLEDKNVGGKIKETPFDIQVDKSVVVKIQEIPFEIQVRTIAQDAWASISHYLDYKKNSVIPEQLKRDFHALSGLFYVADTHFSILRQEQSNIFFENNTKLGTTRFFKPTAGIG